MYPTRGHHTLRGTLGWHHEQSRPRLAWRRTRWHGSRGPTGRGCVTCEAMCVVSSFRRTRVTERVTACALPVALVTHHHAKLQGDILIEQPLLMVCTNDRKKASIVRHMHAKRHNDTRSLALSLSSRHATLSLSPANTHMYPHTQLYLEVVGDIGCGNEWQQSPLLHLVLQHGLLRLAWRSKLASNSRVSHSNGHSRACVG